MKRKVLKKDLLNDSNIKWNEFIDLIATENYDNMNEFQKKAHVVFYFEQEIQNGGFVQYFTNQGTNKLDELIAALRFMNAIDQLAILEEVLNIFVTIKIGSFDNMYEFVNEVFVNYGYKYESSDIEESCHQVISNAELAYYNCKPSIVNCLENYLDKYENEFIDVI